MKNIIIIGAGGHAKVVHDSLNKDSYNTMAIIDPVKKLDNQFSELLHLKKDNDILNKFSIKQHMLIMGIGMVPGKNRYLRKILYTNYKNNGYKFKNIIHSSSILADNTKINTGAQIMAGVIIQVGGTIGENSIVNTGAILDHDCDIGRNTHIAPGTIICGNVKVGNDCFIGAGAKILPGSIIPNDTDIKAGVIINKDTIFK